CQDEKYMLENIKFQIGTDLRGEAGGSVEANLDLLNQCFDGNSKDFNRPLNQLGMDNRVQSLAQTATNLRNLKCQNKKLEVSTDSCAKQSELDDKGASDKR